MGRGAYVEGGLSGRSGDARAAVDVQAAAVVRDGIVVTVVGASDLHVGKCQVAVVLDEHGGQAAGERTVLQLELAALLKVPRLVLRSGGADKALAHAVVVAAEVDHDVLRMGGNRLDAVSVLNVAEKRDQGGLGSVVGNGGNGVVEGLVLHVTDLGDKYALLHTVLALSEVCRDVSLGAELCGNRRAEGTAGNSRVKCFICLVSQFSVCEVTTANLNAGIVGIGGMNQTVV